ncbi:MAG: hypothetical protein A3H94_04755 [Acidobacteria bacterium RIFCSPLOWO2_02_FULL_60_20]|nr:MAG: hypothetical protein A3H94_04755 [Acidobacteria bacterium RIFCSPLOWO2_02_FULL_60_20]
MLQVYAFYRLHQVKDHYEKRLTEANPQITLGLHLLAQESSDGVSQPVSPGGTGAVFAVGGGW